MCPCPPSFPQLDADCAAGCCWFLLDDFLPCLLQVLGDECCSSRQHDQNAGSTRVPNAPARPCRPCSGSSLLWSQVGAHPHMPLASKEQARRVSSKSRQRLCFIRASRVLHNRAQGQRTHCCHQMRCTDDCAQPKAVSNYRQRLRCCCSLLNNCLAACWMLPQGDTLDCVGYIQKGLEHGADHPGRAAAAGAAA